MSPILVTSTLMLALLTGVFPTAIIGIIMHYKGWMQAIPSEHRTTTMYCTWALSTIVIFTAMTKMPSVFPMS